MSNFWTVKTAAGREFSLKRLAFSVAIVIIAVFPVTVLSIFGEKVIDNCFNFYYITLPILLGTYAGKSFLEQKFEPGEAKP